MIYLINVGGNIATLRDSETKEVKNLTDSGQWGRINGRKDFSEYNKTSKKVSKKKAK